MGGWGRASEELTELLDQALAGFDQSRRFMFGGPAHFVNGNMFAAVHTSNLVIRLSEEDRREFAAAYQDAQPFEPMPGRIMREYLVVPDTLRFDQGLLQMWLDRSHSYVASLPPKTPKPPKRPKGS